MKRNEILSTVLSYGWMTENMRSRIREEWESLTDNEKTILTTHSDRVEKTLREYKSLENAAKVIFMTCPEYANKCDICPYNNGFDNWQDRRPCGQWHCWTVVTCNRK